MQDLGAERARPRLDLRVHAPGETMDGEPILIVEDRTRTGSSSGTVKALGLTIPQSLLQRADDPLMFPMLRSAGRDHNLARVLGRRWEDSLV